MGVFACGWLGFVFALGVCSSFGVCVFGVGVLVGWWDSVVPPPPLFCPACLLVCLRFGVGLLACAVLPLGAG